jgi:hypothetical protein
MAYGKNQSGRITVLTKYRVAQDVRIVATGEVGEVTRVIEFVTGPAATCYLVSLADRLPRVYTEQELERA